MLKLKILAGLMVVSLSIFGNKTANDSIRIVIQDLCWSPDDHFIYFSAMKVKADYSDYRPELWTVYRYDLINKQVKVIAESALNVAVSPDGKQLAIGLNEGGGRKIYLSDNLGNSRQLLIEMGTKSAAPCWSPSGDRIIFNSNKSGNTEIYCWYKQSNQIVQLTDSEGHQAYNPTWSPDGKHIAYYLEKGDGMDQIHVIKADGSKDRNITSDNFNNIFPAWFGKKNIIYGQDSKTGKAKLFEIKINGKGKKQVDQIESFFGRFSGNGSMIAYVDTEEGCIVIMDRKRKSVIDRVFPI